MKHNKEKDCWIVLAGKVYDLTQFLDGHAPIGTARIMECTGDGKDYQQEYLKVEHSGKAKNMKKQFYIGEIED